MATTTTAIQREGGVMIDKNKLIELLEEKKKNIEDLIEGSVYYNGMYRGYINAIEIIKEEVT